jgi:hypothetical protein
MLAVLAACGGKPVTFADIPLLPAAAPLQAGTHPFADTVSKTLRDSLGGKNVKLDMQLYGLPTETNWVDVKGFYETQIKGDWKTESRLAQDTPAFKLAGWSRGGFASEQGLVVGYGAGMLGNPPFLIVALFSE